MTTDSSREHDVRLRAVLEEWYLRVDRGERPDLAELCDGDDALARRVRELLDQEPVTLRTPERDLGAGPDPDLGDLASGTRIGPFRILELLGRGGMGTVYLAEQETPLRRVALKVLRQGALADSRARLRFRREADLAAALNHPNVVPIYDVGSVSEEESGPAYISMKYLRGPSLDRLPAPLAPREVARLAERIARALDEAHRCGIVHRDVKPSNVLLDGDEPVLVDFGLARAATDTTITRDGSVTGTLPYLAPELLDESNLRLDPRIDVYGLGATMYELLSGRPPVAPDRPEVMLAQIAWKDPVALRLSGVDRDLETVVEKALEKDPARRIPTAGRLADELDRYLRGEPVELKPVTTVQRVLRLARRHGRVTLALSLAIAVALVLGVFAVDGRLRERRSNQQQLELAGAEMKIQRYGRACEILEGLPADARDEELLTEARARRALEHLLDLAVLAPNVLFDELRSCLRDVRQSEAPGRHPRLTRLGSALVAWHLGERDEARNELSSLSAPVEADRARKALEALVEGKPLVLPETLGAPDLPADERILVATAMRLSGVPLVEQERELERALEVDPLHRRARFALIVVWDQTGLYEQALPVLYGLLREDPEHRGIRRHLVRALLNTGRVDRAREVLDDLPTERWTELEAMLDLNLVSITRDWETFESRIDGYLADLEGGRWETGWSLQRARANYLGSVRGRWDEAFDLLDVVATEADGYLDRDMARATLYEHQVRQAAAAFPAQRAAMYEPLLLEGELLLEELQLTHARAVVGWRYAMALLGSGEVERGFPLLEESVALLPGVPMAQFEYLQELVNYGEYLRGQGAEEEARFLQAEAWKQAQTLVPLVSEESPLLAPHELSLIRAKMIEAASRMNDWRLLGPLIEAQLEHVSSPRDRKRMEEVLGEVDAGLEGTFRD